MNWISDLKGLSPKIQVVLSVAMVCMGAIGAIAAVAQEALKQGHGAAGDE